MAAPDSLYELVEKIKVDEKDERRTFYKDICELSPFVLSAVSMVVSFFGTLSSSSGVKGGLHNKYRNTFSLKRVYLLSKDDDFFECCYQNSKNSLSPTWRDDISPLTKEFESHLYGRHEIVIDDKIGPLTLLSAWLVVSLKCEKCSSHLVEHKSGTLLTMLGSLIVSKQIERFVSGEEVTAHKMLLDELRKEHSNYDVAKVKLSPMSPNAIQLIRESGEKHEIKYCTEFERLEFINKLKKCWTQVPGTDISVEPNDVSYNEPVTVPGTDISVEPNDVSYNEPVTVPGTDISVEPNDVSYNEPVTVPGTDISVEPNDVSYNEPVTVPGTDISVEPNDVSYNEPVTVPGTDISVEPNDVSYNEPVTVPGTDISVEPNDVSYNEPVTVPGTDISVEPNDVSYNEPVTVPGTDVSVEPNDLSYNEPVIVPGTDISVEPNDVSYNEPVTVPGTDISVEPNDVSYNEPVTVRSLDEGSLADYIPHLAEQDPELWGFSLCTVSGMQYSLGDSDTAFSLQSISKPFTYSLAISEHGSEAVRKYIGAEPSGSSFNDMSLDKQKRPYNCMNNNGAIVAVSLIRTIDKPSVRFDAIMDHFRSMAGGEHLGFSNTCYQSEKEVSHRNQTIVHYLQENGSFPEGVSSPLTELDVYLQVCGIEASCQSAAVMAATLAASGTCPVTKKVCIEPSVSREVIAVMMTSGLYNAAGQFTVDVGVPAKSGVSGGIILVIPGRMGICIFSPRLDRFGNSARGVEMSKRISAAFRLHVLD